MATNCTTWRTGWGAPRYGRHSYIYQSLCRPRRGALRQCHEPALILYKIRSTKKENRMYFMNGFFTLFWRFTSMSPRSFLFAGEASGDCCLLALAVCDLRCCRRKYRTFGSILQALHPRDTRGRSSELIFRHSSSVTALPVQNRTLYGRSDDNNVWQ